MTNMLRVPDIDLRSQPTTIAIGEHEVRVAMNLKFPRITVFENFMTRSECEFMIRMAEPKLQRSSTMNYEGNGTEINNIRTSHGCVIPPADNAFIEELDLRVSVLCNWQPQCIEPFHVLKYEEGEEYKPHFDFFIPRPDVPPPGRGGQRLATMLIYLRTPEQGGGTWFPDIGLELKPAVGSAIFFNYPNLFFAKNTLHAGLPVIEGQKWVATRWFREGPL